MSKHKLLGDTICSGDFGFLEDGVNILFPIPPEHHTWSKHKILKGGEKSADHVGRRLPRKLAVSPPGFSFGLTYHRLGAKKLPTQKQI